MNQNTKTAPKSPLRRKRKIFYQVYDVNGNPYKNLFEQDGHYYWFDDENREDAECVGDDLHRALRFHLLKQPDSDC